MERRNFLKSLGAMIAGVALEQAIPLGRVWSFPKEIKLFRAEEPILAAVYFDPAFISRIYYDPIAIREWQANTQFVDVMKHGSLKRRNTDGPKYFGLAKTSCSS